MSNNLNLAENGKTNIGSNGHFMTSTATVLQVCANFILGILKIIYDVGRDRFSELHLGPGWHPS